MNVEEAPWFHTASKRRRYLVGVSGGADSVALLHLLHRAGFRNLVVCHLDHGLRGRTSTADARFVVRLAEKLGLPVECGRVALSSLAGEWGCSLETAGRRARHAFFAQCARRHRCTRLLLAHHADDQAETVLWNLLRGSRGESGMKQEQSIIMDGRRMEVTRPLLTLSRAGLRDWLTAGKLKWREDSTNAEPFAVRNRLRNEAMPLLAEIIGRDPVQALEKAAQSAAELREVEQWAVAQAEMLDPQGRIHLPKLRSLPPALQRAGIHAYLRDHGVPDLDRATITRVLEMLDPGASHALTLPGARTMRRRQGRMWVE